MCVCVGGGGVGGTCGEGDWVRGGCLRGGGWGSFVWGVQGFGGGGDVRGGVVVAGGGGYVPGGGRVCVG